MNNASGKWVLLSGASILLLAGCATPAPKVEVGQAEFALFHAETSGANVGAPLVFRDARNSLNDAKSLMRKKENEKAKRAAEMAQAQAQQAEAMTEAQHWDQATKALRETQKTLENELDRSASGG